MEIYAERARVIGDPWLASARYDEHRSSLRDILRDIEIKLALEPEDDLLDIGAGVGLFTGLLAGLVRSTTAIDHPDCLRAMRLATFQAARVIARPGNFLDLDMSGRTYSKILIYATLHYLADFEELLDFVLKASSLLRKGGRLLVGDIPNESRRQRFVQSDRGRTFEAEWRSHPHDDGSFALTLPPDPTLVRIDDGVIMVLLSGLRSVGFDAFILPQPEQLPFAFVREDLLVCRP